MTQEELVQLKDSMTIKEKVDQMLQLSDAVYQDGSDGLLTGPDRILGLQEEDRKLCGSVLGIYGAEKLMQIQKKYMEEHPHHIPMLFMMDVIHGMKTIFPIPLAQGAAFEPDLAERCAAVAAKEAAVCGLHVTFSPMVDLVRDARWGRVMESTGEDPYLNSLYAAAQVRGYQGDDMGDPYKICSCVKHFAAYGAPTAGREYNTVELSETTLRDFYLKSYQSGIDAGAGMVMTSFNTVNGIPVSTNKWLLREVLRKEMGFDGVLISDFASILDTIAHGNCADKAEAAQKALDAGVDIDMMSDVYSSNLCSLVENGVIPEELIDQSVMRILELKNKLGLFEDPCKDADPEKEKSILLCDEHRSLAREAAEKSFVLLKNDGILPVDRKKKIAFIGPYTSSCELNSNWAITGNPGDCVTLEKAAREVFCPELTTYCKGSSLLGSDRSIEPFNEAEAGTEKLSETEQELLLKEAVEQAENADLVIMPLGESYLQSGEACSRAMIDIPEVQMRLFREVSKVNENIVVILFCGRPLDIREISNKAKAILVAWLPGTEGGSAIVDVLTGKFNPSGRLPMSFPYCVGQVPVFYNEYSTGRPDKPDRKERYHSRYIDIPNEPLYPFGFGLSYTEFEIAPVELSDNLVLPEKDITAKTRVKNTGKRTGTEVVQLYIRDVAASVVRPVKELKGFQKISLLPGEEREVCFEITESMLRFLKADGTTGAENGEFELWIGDSSETKNSTFFRYSDNLAERES